MTRLLSIFWLGLLCIIIGLTHWSPPAFAKADPLVWRKQIIYLLIPDRFANGNPDNDHAVDIDCPYADWNRMFHGGDFAGLKQHVDYLKDLGVTTVWSTPIYEQVPEPVAGVGCGFHGYWPNYRDPYTGPIEPRLGTDEEFTDLLQTLDDHNIRYILDVVVNHTGFASDLLNQHPDWFRVDSDQCQQSDSGMIQCPSPFEVPDL
ncbi:MAG: alpha-amylase family glycosyl hydrolase, partial [Leptolyngbyaceae bacterium]|nr:alpha-amylase family glycosyl hydrolase [Leptolyngbyaceae bacterium]